jgi:hypothetical protein
VADFFRDRLLNMSDRQPREILFLEMAMQALRQYPGGLEG